MTELERKYQKFASQLIHPDAADAQVYGMQLAFYLGALHGTDVQIKAIRAGKDGPETFANVQALRDEIMGELNRLQAVQDAAPEEWFPEGKQ